MAIQNVFVFTGVFVFFWKTVLVFGQPGSVARACARGAVPIRRRQSIVALAPVAPIALVIVIIGAAGCVRAVVVVYRTARHRLRTGVHHISYQRYWTAYTG